VVWDWDSNWFDKAGHFVCFAICPDMQQDTSSPFPDPVEANKSVAPITLRS
jgi:hypothetical protein